MNRCALALAFSLLALAACGDDDAARCVSGSTQACACSGGRSGVQTCNASGSYEACDCGGDGGLVDGSRADGGSDAMVGTGGTVTMMIGASGGEVALGDLRLTVPAGALASTTAITITETTMPTPAGYRAFSPLYEFEPAGLMFSMPATLTLPIRSGAADVPLATLFWSRQSDGTGGFERRGGTPDGTNLTAEIEHFSTGSSPTASITRSCPIRRASDRASSRRVRFSPRASVCSSRWRTVRDARSRT